MTEIWKPIKGFEGLYEISNYGNVKYLPKQSNGFKEGLLKPFVPKVLSINYQRVHLSKDGKYTQMFVHRLVAEHFVTNPENKPYVNHIDNNPLNNHYTNLEWCTQKENIQHSLRQNRRPQNTAKSMQIIAETSRKNTEKFFKNVLQNAFVTISYEQNSKAYVHICCTKCSTVFKTRTDILRNRLKNNFNISICTSCSNSRSIGAIKGWKTRQI